MKGEWGRKVSQLGELHKKGVIRVWIGMEKVLIWQVIVSVGGENLATNNF